MKNDFKPEIKIFAHLYNLDLSDIEQVEIAKEYSKEIPNFSLN